MKEIGCPVCGNPLSVRPAEGRKSRKPFIMLICAVDPTHFRGFIANQPYVLSVMDRTPGTERQTMSPPVRGRSRGGPTAKARKNVDDHT
jgi:hypothetical protein